MKLFRVGAVVCIVLLVSGLVFAKTEKGSDLIDRLFSGNAQYCDGKLPKVDLSTGKKQELAKGGSTPLLRFSPVPIPVLFLSIYLSRGSEIFS